MIRDINKVFVVQLVSRRVGVPRKRVDKTLHRGKLQEKTEFAHQHLTKVQTITAGTRCWFGSLIFGLIRHC